MALRRLAVCRDDLREPVNATERAHMSGDIPYWGANAVQDYVNRAKVSRPVVLLGEDGAPFYDRNKPVAFYIDQPIWPNNHIHVLVPKPEVDGRWLAHALNSVEYSTVISGSTRDKLTQGAMMAIQLLVPPLDEQRAIADYLDQETAQIDALVEKQEEFIGLLQERLNAMTDAEFQQPEGKRNATVRQALVRLERLPQPGSGVVTAYRDGIVTLRTNRRADGYTMSAAEAGYQGVLPGDIVFHALDGFAGAVGISDSAGQCSPVYHVCRPRYDDDVEYLALLIRYLGTSGFLATQAPSTRQRSVDFRNWGTFARVPLTVPPVEHQKVFITSFRRQTAQVNALIAKTEEHIALAKERRSALITAAVTGQIDVRTARKAS